MTISLIKFGPLPPNAENKRILGCIAHDPTPHLQAANRHVDAAANHERIGRFWQEQGDQERADLQHELAEYERHGAELERRWAALIVREAAALE